MPCNTAEQGNGQYTDEAAWSFHIESVRQSAQASMVRAAVDECMLLHMNQTEYGDRYEDVDVTMWRKHAVWA